MESQLFVFLYRSHVRLGEYDTNNPGKDCMEVEANGVDCTDGDINIEISKLIPHEEYTALSRKNDIGLIKLATWAPFTGKYIKFDGFGGAAV